MGLRKDEYMVRKAHLRLPVFEPTSMSFQDSSCSSQTGKTIDVSSMVSRMMIALDTRDNHIEKLLKIVEKLDYIGISFRELEEYRQTHLNNWYDYAKWKPVDKDDFLNKDSQAE